MDDLEDDLREWMAECDGATGAWPAMDLAEWLCATVVALAVGGLLGCCAGHLAGLL